MTYRSSVRFSCSNLTISSHNSLTLSLSVASFSARLVRKSASPGRLTFECTAPPIVVRCDYAEAGNSSAKSINRFFPKINLAQVDTRSDFAYFVADPVRQQRRLRIIEHDALLVVQPARTFIDLGNDRVQSKR